MARRNALKDSTKIYYAYRLGINSKNQEVFDDIREAMALIAEKSGTVADSRMGSQTSYDVQFIVNLD